jgi:hypothetical protein
MSDITDTLHTEPRTPDRPTRPVSPNAPVIERYQAEPLIETGICIKTSIIFNEINDYPDEYPTPQRQTVPQDPKAPIKTPRKFEPFGVDPPSEPNFS